MPGAHAFFVHIFVFLVFFFLFFFFLFFFFTSTWTIIAVDLKDLVVRPAGLLELLRAVDVVVDVVEVVQRVFASRIQVLIRQIRLDLHVPQVDPD